MSKAPATSRPAAIRSIATPATRLVAICAKCGKKLGGGFGPTGDQPLAKALRQALALPKPKRARVRITETRCLKLCPKGAVAVIHSGDPGAILVIPAATPITAIAAHLALLPLLPAPDNAAVRPPLQLAADRR